MTGVVLYGPPAAGKDTVADALSSLDSRYATFHRIKVGGGRTEGYRISTQVAVDALRAKGQVIYENHRYGSSYYIDRTGLKAALTAGIPLVHLGQAEGIAAIQSAFPNERWVLVHLWCSRELAAERIAARGTGDDAARLEAWDQTARIDADIFIDSGVSSPTDSAEVIHSAVFPTIAHQGTG